MSSGLGRDGAGPEEDGGRTIGQRVEAGRSDISLALSTTSAVYYGEEKREKVKEGGGIRKREGDGLRAR